MEACFYKHEDYLFRDMTQLSMYFTDCDPVIASLPDFDLKKSDCLHIPFKSTVNRVQRFGKSDSDILGMQITTI